MASCSGTTSYANKNILTLNLHDGQVAADV